MDALIITVAAVIVSLIYMPPTENIVQMDEEGNFEPVVQKEAFQLNPRLNPAMYHDENAFMRIANELGFR